MNEVKRRLTEFDERHGDFVVTQGWLLFEDGGTRESHNPYGALIEPDEDLYKRSRLIVKFHEIKLGLAVEQFSQRKNHLLSLARNTMRERFCCGPPMSREMALEELQEFQEIVRTCQAKLEAAKKEAEANKPQSLVTSEKANEENRTRCGDFISALEKIEV